MTNKETRSFTDAEMDDLVISDASDPSAWGEPIVVGPSKGPRRAQRVKHLELASKFYVLSVLHRLGADATMTFSHADNVDIMVALESGKALTIDIKTLTGTTEWPVSGFRARAGHFLAYVCYPAAADASVPPSVYIVASEQLRAFVDGHSEPTLSLVRLDEELKAREAWQQLAVSTAA